MRPCLSPHFLTFVLKRRRGGWVSTHRRGSETLSNRISPREAVGGSSSDFNLFAPPSFLFHFMLAFFFFFFSFPLTSNQRWKRKTECRQVDASRGSQVDSGTRLPWEKQETRRGRVCSTARVQPEVAEGRAPPAAASNPSPGPAPPARARCGLPSRGFDVATGRAGEA